VILAAGYTLTGIVGLSLAVPPGYATAVWPPSGIALAAVLLWGPRVWPGIAAGSVLVNLGVALTTAEVAFTAMSVVIALAIAAGSTAQASASPRSSSRGRGRSCSPASPRPPA
jgi:integral membrane sensor domain MASE1